MTVMKNTVTEIPSDLILSQLRKLLESEEIRNSKVLVKFLEYIIIEKMAGRGEGIKEYTIGIKVLGRPSDFNPQLDSVVRIHAGRLRRAIHYYYQEQGKNDELIISIPKGAYVPVFEYRTEKTEEKPHTNGHHHQKVEDLGFPLDRTRTKPRLAVLPFHNLSSDNSTDYFANGMGEQLCSNLARFQNVSMISYYYTLQYGSALNELQELKSTMGVGYVITGSIRLANQKLRLGVQLINAESGEIIWSESYHRLMTPSNMFDVQEEIIGQVLNVVADDNGLLVKRNKTLLPDLTVDGISVQQAIYQYFDYSLDYNPEKFQGVLKSVEKAVAVEPKHALAAAILSGLYLELYCRNLEEDRELLNKALALARTSVQTDPFCQHGHRAQGWALLVSGKPEACLESFEKCIQLNPRSASHLSTVGLGLICAGEYGKGYNYLLEATHLNPGILGSCRLGFALYYFHLKNYAESQKWLEVLVPYNYNSILLLETACRSQTGPEKYKEKRKDILALAPYAQSIIGRLVVDRELNASVMAGLKSAGMKV